jgi:WD40 repeat protein
VTVDEPRTTPYPGLRPFEADEAHLFFGRDEQIDELLRRLHDHRFLALVGTSGSGKSSLVRAGLLPDLLGGFMVKAGSAWRIATMKPGADPIGNLARALNAHDVFGADGAGNDLTLSAGAFTEVTLRRGPLGLVEATSHAGLAGDENLLVLVDQFEELFRFSKLAEPGRTDDTAAFVKLLLAASRHAEGAIYVIITLRSEFLGECARFRGLAEAINQGQYLVPRLTRDQLREAIVGPARVGGAEVTPRLVQQLLGDAGDEPNQLPVLQHALMRTWDLRALNGDVSGPLDLPSYLETGGMSEALSRHANDVYNSLPDGKSREIARKLFERLTETRDGISVRRPTRLREISEVAGAGEADVIRVVDAFRRADRSFVMPTETPLDGESTLDISHESLITLWDRLKGWTSEEQASAEQYRRLCEAAELYRTNKGSLWVSPALDIGLDWREKVRPTAAWAKRYNPEFNQAMGFLEQSERQQQTDRARQKRDRTTRRIGVTVALSIVFAAMALALVQSRRAQALATSAELDARIRAASAVTEPLVRALLLAELGARADDEQIDQHLEQYHEAATAAIPLGVLGSARAASLRGVGFVANATIAAISADGVLFSWRSDGTGNPTALAIPGPNVAEARGNPAASSSSSPLTASFSRDGRWMAGWNDDDVWIGRGDGSTGFRNAGHTVRKENASVAALAFSHDGLRVAVGYSDRTARVWWHDATGEAVLKPGPIELAKGHPSTILSIAFDPTGTRLALGYIDGTTRVWTLHGHIKPGVELGGGDGRVQSVAFSPDGEWVLCGYDNRVARIWRSDGNRSDGVALGHDAPVMAADFSPDGSKVVTVSGDRGLVWTVRTKVRDAGKQRSSLEIVGSPRILAHGSKLTAVAVSQDGQKIVTASHDGTARVWWSESQEPRVLGMHDARVESVAFSPDAKQVISASDDGTARVWAIDGRTGPLVLEGHNNWVRSAVFSPVDGRKVLTASEDSTLRLWNLAGPTKSKVLQEGDKVLGADFDNRGARVVTAVVDKTARVWKTSSLELGGRPLEGPESSGAEELPHADWVLNAAFNGDGSRIVTASKDGRVSIWAPGRDSREPEQVFDHLQMVYGASFSPDGSRIVTASADGFARIWYLDGSRSPMSLPHTEDVYKAAFSSDGRWIVTASLDGTAAVWHSESGRKRVILQPGKEAVRAACFSPSASEVVTGTADGFVRLWRIEPTALLRYLQGASTACLDRRTRVQFLGESEEEAAVRATACESRHGRTAAARH